MILWKWLPLLTVTILTFIIIIIFYKTIEHFSYFSNHCPCQLFIWWSQIWHYHLWLLGYAPSTMENLVWMFWVEAYAFHNCSGSVRCSVMHTTFWLCLFIWWWPIWQSIWFLNFGLCSDSVEQTIWMEHVQYGCNHSVHNQKTCYFIILDDYLMITNVTLLHFDLWALHACLLSYFGLSQYLAFPCYNVFCLKNVLLNRMLVYKFEWIVWSSFPFSMLSLLMWSSSLRVALRAIDYSVSRYITQLLLHTTNQPRPNW